MTVHFSFTSQWATSCSHLLVHILSEVNYPDCIYFQVVITDKKGNVSYSSCLKNPKYDQDDVQKKGQSGKNSIIQIKEHPLMTGEAIHYRKNEIGPLKLLRFASVRSNQKQEHCGQTACSSQADKRAAFEDRTSGKHQRSCLTTPLGLEEQEMGGREREREREWTE